METEQTWRGRMGVGQCSKSAVGCEQMFSGARWADSLNLSKTSSAIFLTDGKPSAMNVIMMSQGLGKEQCCVELRFLPGVRCVCFPGHGWLLLCCRRWRTADCAAWWWNSCVCWREQSKNHRWISCQCSPLLAPPPPLPQGILRCLTLCCGSAFLFFYSKEICQQMNCVVYVWKLWMWMQCISCALCIRQCYLAFIVMLIHLVFYASWKVSGLFYTVTTILLYQTESLLVSLCVQRWKNKQQQKKLTYSYARKWNMLHADATLNAGRVV